MSTVTLSTSSIWADFKEITKHRLSVSVVFSSLAGYLLGIFDWNDFSWGTLALLSIGGYCMVGASNTYNQIIEKDLDALMQRTKNRPIPTNRISTNKAFWLANLLTLTGIILLYLVNAKTAMFGAISIFMYTSLYTPLKTVTPLAVFVGAFPGAIPFMLGWVAATGHFGLEAGTLFIIQFFWQFPHFWAIGWFLHDDYQKAGFKMLPTNQRDQSTTLQIILYTIWLLIASILPALYPYFKISSRLYLTEISAVIVLLLGFWLLYHGFKLYQLKTEKQARKLMLVSVLYITLIQIIYVADKFLR
ncbi:MAG: heme o synthase [Flavobacterium sp.]